MVTLDRIFRLLVCLGTTSLLFGMSTLPQDAAAFEKARVQPWKENRRFWQYRGEPVLLVGGTKEDNLFQIDDLEAHLDLLASGGGNYIRNTMSSRDPGDTWPFEKDADGRYDLEKPSTEYFDRFETCLRLCHERDIIVQIELWDRFDFARDPWQGNPYRPANNVNYTESEIGLENDYPSHPGKNENRFFYSVPGLDKNKALLRYQHIQVDRMLEISLRYPNVIYCMDNETSGDPKWSAYWAEYLKAVANYRGAGIEITEMWDAHDIKAREHRATFDHPRRYSFVDVSQNNHQVGEAHWDNFQWARKYIGKSPRPMNVVKTYGADGGRHGDEMNGKERFWRSLFAGAAGVRFHRPPSGLGLNPTARTQIRSVRMIQRAFDFLRAEPDTAHRLFIRRNPHEAYISHIADEAVAVYFPKGGEVKIDTSGIPGDMELLWFDLIHGEQRDSILLSQSATRKLDAPDDEQWVAVMRSQKD